MNVLAFEADDTQTEAIRHVVCDHVGARLTVATSLEHLLHALRQETPDLVLLPALVSPSQENALVETLRSLPDASHVETLLTPVLPSRELASAPQGWRRWTSRRASGAPPTAAEVSAFAERVHWALERARDKRAHAPLGERYEPMPSLPPEPPVAPEEAPDLPSLLAPEAPDLPSLLAPEAPELQSLLVPADAEADEDLPEPVRLAEEAVDPDATRLVEPVMFTVEPVASTVEGPSSLLQLLEGFGEPRVTAPEDLELADATSRLLKKLNRSDAGVQRTDPGDRRQYRRFAARELPGLRSARIKFGPDVALVDVSAGGALIETDARLQPESEALLELVGSDRQAVVPFRVLRCQITAINGAPRYLGACVFKEPLDLDELAWAGIGISEPEPRLPALTLVPVRTAVRNAW